MWLARMPMIFAIAMIGGCGGDFCRIASPIYPGEDDQMTEATMRQVVQHNETGEKLCRWKP